VQQGTTREERNALVPIREQIMYLAVPTAAEQKAALRRRQSVQRRRFGRAFKEERQRLGLSQEAIVDAFYARTGQNYHGSWVSKVEAGSVRKLDRPLVVALVKALGTDPIRERALLVAAGLSPIAAKSWDDSLAVGYLVTVAAPLLDQIAVLAHRPVAADQTGPDRAVCDGQAREMLAHVLPFSAR
jgi:transcriptional regulator with XRE-family HTH domain